MTDADRVALAEDMPAIERLLRSCDLPVDDLVDLSHSCFRVVYRETELLACGAVEFRGALGLLRSVATHPGARGRGLAGRVVDALETDAEAAGIQALYLLTESAPDFFASRGYCVVAREAVPERIRDTRQFTSLCPESAVVMYRSLG